MKKLIPALLLFIGSFFIGNTANAAQSVTANAEKKTITEEAISNYEDNAVVTGHWVIVCIYNPVTRMFELHMIWVEDEDM
jgi:hypothetical protein